MSIDLHLDYFALFGVEPKFMLDLRALEQRYRELQHGVHPDRFASQNDAAQRQSLQWATHVNSAWQTLKQPLTRARYLLQLHGVDTAEESNTAMPADFLLTQMEWREASAEARQAGDVARLEQLEQQVRGDIRALEAELAELLDVQHHWAAAALAVRKMRFLEKLQQEVGDAISDLLGH